MSLSLLGHNGRPGERDDIVGRNQRGGELMFPRIKGMPGSGRAVMLPGALSCLIGSADPKKF